MITWKGLALQKDFVSSFTFLAWTVEARHQNMKISSETPHDRDLGLKGPYDWSHELGSMVIHIEKGW